MFLRKLVSTPLIWAVFFTSINARAPRFSQENSVLFLVDENRDMRCRLTPEAVRLFSWEYLLELAGTEALALIGDPPIDDLRPCNENDVMYAKVVFPPDFAAKSGLTGSLVKAWVIIKVIGTVASLGFLAAFIYVLGIVGEENGSRAPAPPVSALDPIIAILNRMLVECAGNDVLISSQEGWFRCQLAENGGPFGPELMFSLPIEREFFGLMQEGYCGERRLLIGESEIRCGDVD